MADSNVDEMELRAQIEEDYLTCQICQGPYTKPKALNCLHSFCAYCLDEYLGAKKVPPGGSFECPVCRKSIELPVNGIKEFPDNHLIMSLADTISNRRPLFLQQRMDNILDPNQGNLPLQFQDGAPANAGKDTDEDFARIFEGNEEEVFSDESRLMDSNHITLDDDQEPPRRESTSSDRSTINRLKDLQQEEVFNLINCLSNITDHIHVSRDSRDGESENTVRSARNPTNTLDTNRQCTEDARPSTSSVQQNTDARPVTVNSITVPYHRRDVPATPSHMQIKIDDLPFTLNWRESSFTRDRLKNRAPSSNVRLHRSYDFETTTRGHNTTSSENERLSRSDNFGSTAVDDTSFNSLPPGFYPVALDRQSESLSNRIMPSNPTPIKTLGQYGLGMFDLHTPIGIATAHDGNTVLVSDQSKCRILIYDLESGIMPGCIRCEGEIKDLTISTMGHILVATYKASSILANAYTFEGHKIASLGKFFAHEHAHGISASGDHKVAVTCLSGAVYVLNENGKMLQQFGRRGRDMTLFATPYYVTFNHKSQILISDYDANSVKVYNLSGQFQFSFGGSHAEAKDLNRPSGLTVDANNNIIVSDFGSGSVKLFTPEGKFVKRIVKYSQNVGPDQVVRPLNVALANNDKLLVLVRGSHFAQVQVFEYNLELLKMEPRSSICTIF